ncbi:MAG TPA: SpoIIE family protein phosphatase [Holophagaceae bacterium]|nr:SpoIIE family protein phosphatase [Holophagaceae bacterium]
MNPYLRRIRWRLVWISAICLLLSVGGFVATQWVYSTSDDQCSWTLQEGKVVITEILPGGVAEEAGLLEGDQLLSIQGHRVPATAEGTQEAQALINAKSEGTVLSYAVSRKGKILYLPVRLVKFMDWSRVVQLVTGLLAWLLGLLVVVSTPERKTSRHFFYIACAWLLVVNGGGFGIGSAPLGILWPLILGSLVSLAIGPPLLVHFFLRFPYPHELRKREGWIRGLYGAFTVLALLTFLATLMGGPGRPLLSALGIPPPSPAFRQVFGTLVGRLQTLALVGAFTSAMALFVSGFRCLEPRLKRAVLPCLVITGAVLAEQLVAAWLGFVNGGSLLFARQRWVLLLPLPLLPLCFAYAVIRFGLFDVRRALLRWVSYVALLGGVMLAYFGGIVWLFAEGVSAVPALWMAVLVGLLALPLGWVRARLVRAVRRRFHRDSETVREQLLGSLRDTRKRLSEEGVYQALSEGIQAALHPSGLWVLPFEGDTLALPACEGFPAQGLRLPASLARHARDNRELVLGLGSEEADWIREQGERIRAHVDALEGQILLLLMVAERPHAAILLGSKYAELNYGRKDRELLREAAINGGVILETAVMHRRLVAQERATQELETARKIQEGLITRDPPKVPGFQLALRLEPAMETGGDLLFVKKRPSGRWLAAVGDVSGKGLAAALYMAQATALLEQAAQQEDRPLEAILCSLDETLRHLLGSTGFLTLILVEWDSEGAYRLARAGHPGALLVEEQGEVRELLPKGRGLGLRPMRAANPLDWEIQEGVLAPKAWLALYSDGLSEAMDRRGELYGLDRMRDQLRKLWATGSVRAACEAVFRDVAAYDTQNRDDRTLFILGREAAS